MSKDDPYIRWNRARARKEKIDHIKQWLMIILFLVGCVYVVWDVGHYEPDSEQIEGSAP